MDAVFKYIGGFVKGLTGFLIGLLGLAIVAEILFGGAVFGMEVLTNISSLVGDLAGGGIVGVITLLIGWGLISK